MLSQEQLEKLENAVVMGAVVKLLPIGNPQNITWLKLQLLDKSVAYFPLTNIMGDYTVDYVKTDMVGRRIICLSSADHREWNNTKLLKLALAATTTSYHGKFFRVYEDFSSEELPDTLSLLTYHGALNYIVFGEIE